MPFYSQAAVDSHYRRVSGHNETAGDKEFEDDSQLLQWYVQRAKQVLRERNEKDGRGEQDASHNNPAASVPIPINRRQRRSIAASQLPRISKFLDPRPTWEQFQSGWKSGNERIRKTQELSTDSGKAEANKFHRKFWDSTGFVFNGSVVLPNGFF